jgi:ABC-type bacteriocin/lantibiotic exporter with double-glycine peptidase domain
VSDAGFGVPKEPERPVPTLREVLPKVARLLRLVTPYRGLLVRGAALGLTISLFGLIGPLLSKMLIDDVYAGGDVSLLQALVLGNFVVAVTAALLGGLRGYLSQYTTTVLNRAVGLLFFNHVQHLPTRFFDRNRVGDIASRFGDARASLSAIASTLELAVVGGTYLLIVPPVLISIDWRLALVAVAALPLSLAISLAAAATLRERYLRSAEASASQMAFQLECLTHVRTYKALAAEDFVFGAARLQADASAERQLDAARVAGFTSLVRSVVTAAGAGVYMWYAWSMIVKGRITLGDYVLFSAYIGYVTGPAGQIASLVSNFPRTSVTLVRLFEFLDEQPEQDPEIVIRRRTSAQVPVRGALRLRDVVFGYSDGNPVLRGVSMTMERGRVTAIVGESGSGKTSILRLLTGVDKPWSGMVTVDEQPIASIPLGDLRRQVTVVWQDVVLVRGSLRHNLTLGQTSVTSESIERAVKACMLQELVSELPDGLETAVGEWGTTMSGGQRQRIAIARALLRDSPVLLLDEPLSQLDSDTESRVLMGIRELIGPRTLVLVTHRPSVAAAADAVVHLTKGTVVEAGTHGSLLDRSGEYRGLMRSAASRPERGRVPLAVER